MLKTFYNNITSKINKCKNYFINNGVWQIDTMFNNKYILSWNCSKFNKLKTIKDIGLLYIIFGNDYLPKNNSFNDSIFVYLMLHYIYMYVVCKTGEYIITDNNSVNFNFILKYIEEMWYIEY